MYASVLDAAITAGDFCRGGTPAPNRPGCVALPDASAHGPRRV